MGIYRICYPSKARETLIAVSLQPTNLVQLYILLFVRMLHSSLATSLTAEGRRQGKPPRPCSAPLRSLSLPPKDDAMTFLFLVILTAILPREGLATTSAVQSLKDLLASTSSCQQTPTTLTCFFMGTIILSSADSRNAWPSSTSISTLTLIGESPLSSHIQLDPSHPYLLSGSRTLTIVTATVDSGLAFRVGNASGGSAASVQRQGSAFSGSSQSGFMSILMAGLETAGSGALINLQVSECRPYVIPGSMAHVIYMA